MVCHQENESVGFVKLLPTAMEGAFLHLRADRVVAKVMPQNLRSIRCVRACGFQQMAEMPRLVRFEITFDAYCQALREKRA